MVRTELLVELEALLVHHGERAAEVLVQRDALLDVGQRLLVVDLDLLVFDRLFFLLFFGPLRESTLTFLHLFL